MVADEGKTVVVRLGDGVNDARGPIQANVSAAIGPGTNVEIESADIVLARSDPRDLRTIVRLEEKSYSKLAQNLWWATGYNAVTILLAAGVLAPIGIILPPAVRAAVMRCPRSSWRSTHACRGFRSRRLHSAATARVSCIHE